MITKEDIKNLADLARIEVTPTEMESLTSEVDSILGYVGQIQSGSATKHEMGSTELSKENVRNVLRDDVPTNSSGEYKEKLLENAPSREGDYLKVKKIL